MFRELGLVLLLVVMGVGATMHYVEYRTDKKIDQKIEENQKKKVEKNGK
jgi:hypothetical protein